jgi:hypothetical protein
VSSGFNSKEAEEKSSCPGFVVAVEIATSVDIGVAVEIATSVDIGVAVGNISDGLCNPQAVIIRMAKSRMDGMRFKGPPFWTSSIMKSVLC